MKRLFRPTTLVLLAAVLGLVAAGFFAWPFGGRAAINRALPRPVPAGDQEVVWLNAATSAGWERFVAAVRRLKEDRPDLNLDIVTDANAFPDQTTAVPEFAITAGGSRSRLWFRWYKLTGDIDTRKWVQALAQRDPAPLAVIGGGSSDRARDLAGELNDLRPGLASPPLLLITTATADQVDVGNQEKDLMEIYPGRSFRFCFTNNQMAEAVLNFVWHQEALRPDAEPFYLPYWNDDPYSEDLSRRFHEVLQEQKRLRTLRLAVRDWAWLAGRFTLGGVPPGLDLEGLRRPRLCVPSQGSEAGMPPRSFWRAEIPYSVGPFGRPNRWETGATEKLVDELVQHPNQQRPLLVLPAVPQPARRFLRGLVRVAPADVRRFVVATGDAIDFNTIYRDRNVLWPIQDLPFDLVFFCHRNPIDPAAFRPDRPGIDADPPDPGGKTSTGTQDLLLYRDIVQTIVGAAYQGRGLLQHADELARTLHESAEGRSRFDAAGNQLSGTGEYVVHLQPLREGDRVLPQAYLQVWNRSMNAGGGRRWLLVPEPLVVDYTSAAGAGLVGDLR